MKIAILGAGAMGALHGGYLSLTNEVYLIDTDVAKVDAINKNGVKIKQKDEDKIFYPKAATSCVGLGKMDLLVIFVKSMFSEQALLENLALIGENTYVMSLQNGAGHGDMLKKHIKPEKIIVGTTMHNAYLIEPGYICHSGRGKNNIGALDGFPPPPPEIAEAFTSAGLETEIWDDVRRLIWKKLFLNVSVTVMNGILQTKLGYILDNASAWALTERLLDEAIAVARADGAEFDPDSVKGDIKKALDGAREGFTSMYADIRDKRKTEVETISGYVVRTAKRTNTPAPSHEFIVQLIHALEDRP